MKKVNTYLLMPLFFLMLLGCQETTQKEEPAASDEIAFTSASDEALAQFNQGLEIFDIGDGQSARAYFTRAIELDENFTSAYVFRSFTSGSAEEFRADTDRAVESMENASDGEKILVDRNLTFIESDSEKRMELLKALAEQYPNSSRAHQLLGFEYEARNNHEMARNEYSKAIELNPEWVGGHNSLGLSYLFSDPKDFTKAEEIMAMVVTMVPNQARAQINLGDCYRAQNSLEQARDSYAKAIELNPQDPVAHMKKGHANSFLGNLDEARTDFQNGREYDENKNVTFEGFTYLYEGNPDEALEWIAEQMENLDQYGLSESRTDATKMTCINVCSWIAMHHNKVDHIKELISQRAPISEKIGESLESEIARSTQKATMAYWEGIAAAMEGDYETAMAKADERNTLMEASTNPRKMETTHFMNGFTYFKQGSYEDAVTHLEQANPNSLYVKYLLAMSHEQLDNTDRSTELLMEISDNNFNNVQYAILRNEVKEKLASM